MEKQNNLPDTQRENKTPSPPKVALASSMFKKSKSKSKNRVEHKTVRSDSKMLLDRAKQIIPDLEKLDIAPILIHFVENLTDEQWRSIRNAIPSPETKTMISHMGSVIVDTVAEATLKGLFPALKEILGVDLRSVLVSDSAGICESDTEDISSTRPFESCLRSTPLQQRFGITEDTVLNNIQESIELSVSKVYSEVELRWRELSRAIVREVVHQVNLALQLKMNEAASRPIPLVLHPDNTSIGNKAVKKVVNMVSSMLHAFRIGRSEITRSVSVTVTEERTPTDSMTGDILDDDETDPELMKIMSTPEDMNSEVMSEVLIAHSKSLTSLSLDFQDDDTSRPISTIPNVGSKTPDMLKRFNDDMQEFAEIVQDDNGPYMTGNIQLLSNQDNGVIHSVSKTSAAVSFYHTIQNKLRNLFTVPSHLKEIDSTESSLHLLSEIDIDSVGDSVHLSGDLEENSPVALLAKTSIIQVLESITTELQQSEQTQEHLLAREVLDSMLEYVEKEDDDFGEVKNFEGPQEFMSSMPSSSKASKSSSSLSSHSNTRRMLPSQETSPQISSLQCGPSIARPIENTIMHSIVDTIFGRFNSEDEQNMSSSSLMLTVDKLQTLISSGSISKLSKDLVDQIRWHLMKDLSPQVKNLTAGRSASDTILFMALKEKSISKSDAYQLVYDFAQESVKHLLLSCQQSLNSDLEGSSPSGPCDDAVIPVTIVQDDLKASQAPSELFTDTVNTFSKVMANQVIDVVNTALVKKPQESLSIQNDRSSMVSVSLHSSPSRRSVKSDSQMSVSTRTSQVPANSNQVIDADAVPWLPIHVEPCDGAHADLFTVLIMRLLVKIQHQLGTSPEISHKTHELISQFLSMLSTSSDPDSTEIRTQNMKMHQIYETLYKNLVEEYGSAHLLDGVIESQNSTFDEILISSLAEALEPEDGSRTISMASLPSTEPALDIQDNTTKAKKGSMHLPFHLTVKFSKLSQTFKKLKRKSNKVHCVPTENQCPTAVTDAPTIGAENVSAISLKKSSSLFTRMFLLLTRKRSVSD